MRAHTTGLPRFAAGPSVHATSWTSWKQDHQEDESFYDYLSRRLAAGAQRQPQAAISTPKLVIFGEQHHQPRVLAAQLQMVHHIATAIAKSASTKVKIVMEHFNLRQQHLLDDFAKTGDPTPLQEEYVKSNEGFRIDDSGYLPLLKLARELEYPVIAGFPPRKWARTIMREGKKGIDDSTEIQASHLLDGFGRWQDLNVQPEHAAYIKSSISGEKPTVIDPVDQGGLKAAQAFKDAIMAWKIDQELGHRQEKTGPDEHELEAPSSVVVLAICGSGHCEYGFGVTERVRAASRSDTVLVVTKPDDGEFWDVAQTPNNSETERCNDSTDAPRKLADAVIIYEAVDI